MLRSLLQGSFRPVKPYARIALTRTLLVGSQSYQAPGYRQRWYSTFDLPESKTQITLEDILPDSKYASIQRAVWKQRTDLLTLRKVLVRTPLITDSNLFRN